MKKTLLILSLVCLVTIVYGQKSQQQKIDSVCQLVKKYWAEKNADKLYEMAGAEFKQQISLSDFKTACTQTLFPKGKMKTTFENFENGTNKYKAVFPSDSLSFYLSLDNNNKLGTFLFKPYGN